MFNCCRNCHYLHIRWVFFGSWRCRRPISKDRVTGRVIEVYDRPAREAREDDCKGAWFSPTY